MSAAAAIAASPAVVVRPRLVVIHGESAREEAAPDRALGSGAPGGAYQEELPLRWPAERRTGSALASYPPLPLDPGVPRPDPYVAQIATILADVLTGARPARQLERYALIDLCQRLGRQTRLRQGDDRGVNRAQVTSTSTMVVSGTAAQVVVVFRSQGRGRAAALRLEYRHNRWLLTDVQTPG